MLAALYLLAMVGTLAAMGALSVKHRAGTAATTAALFSAAILMAPVFAVAATMGVADRAQAALSDIFSEDDPLPAEEDPFAIDEKEPPEEPTEDLSPDERVALDFFTAA